MAVMTSHSQSHARRKQSQLVSEIVMLTYQQDFRFINLQQNGRKLKLNSCAGHS